MVFSLRLLKSNTPFLPTISLQLFTACLVPPAKLTRPQEPSQFLLITPGPEIPCLHCIPSPSQPFSPWWVRNRRLHHTAQGTAAVVTQPLHLALCCCFEKWRRMRRQRKTSHAQPGGLFVLTGCAGLCPAFLDLQLPTDSHLLLCSNRSSCSARDNLSRRLVKGVAKLMRLSLWLNRCQEKLK